MCECVWARLSIPTRQREGEKLVTQPPTPSLQSRPPLGPPLSVRTSAEATSLQFLSLLHLRIHFAPSVLSLNQQAGGRKAFCFPPE